MQRSPAMDLWGTPECNIPTAPDYRLGTAYEATRAACTGCKLHCKFALFKTGKMRYKNITY